MPFGSAGLLAWSLALAATLSTSHALLKMSATREAVDLAYVLQVASALSLYGVVFAVYSWLLRKYELGALYPTYTGLSVIAVVLIGSLFFDERLTSSRLLGMVTIAIGIGLAIRD